MTKIGELFEKHAAMLAGDCWNLAVIRAAAIRAMAGGTGVEQNCPALEIRFERSAFADLFRNVWLWGAIGISLALHVLVLTLPVLQRAFGTVALDAREWLLCTAVASSVLWIRELGKLVTRLRT